MKTAAPAERAGALAQRQGVGASRVFVPAGPWANLFDFLCARFAHIAPAQWHDRLARGEVCDAQGQPISPASALHAPCPSGCWVHYWRAVADEPAGAAGQALVLYEDARLLVLDKPHGVPVTPSGDYVQRSLLVHWRVRTGCAALTPLHRLDRDTAGVVLLSKQAAQRDAYSALFRQHAVHKVYEAVAPWQAALTQPTWRVSRLQAGAHFLLQREVAGPPNARTFIRMLAAQDATPPSAAPPDAAAPEAGTSTSHAAPMRWALYRLEPQTGQRHQLRVHMCALSAPIRFDGFYPQLSPAGDMPPDRPLQLLARSVALRDPFSGRALRWISQRSLRWPLPPQAD